jgi:hypothetical protein
MVMIESAVVVEVRETVVTGVYVVVTAAVFVLKIVFVVEGTGETDNVPSFVEHFKASVEVTVLEEHVRNSAGSTARKRLKIMVDESNLFD